MLRRAFRLICRATYSIKCRSATTIAADGFPVHRRPNERKPLIVGITELKRRAREERATRRSEGVREIELQPPENGLLVKHLIPVAHEVLAARENLLHSAARVLESLAVHICRVCGEVHVGREAHQIRTCNVAGSLPTKEHSWIGGGIEHLLPDVLSFHLYDRLGRAVSHEERVRVDRISAILELCVQAGVDLLEYPTKRRAFPVYSISGKIIDFERKYPRDFSSGMDIEPFGLWRRKMDVSHQSKSFSCQRSSIEVLTCLDADAAIQGMKAWETLRSGACKLMEKYQVLTCGFCPEVQVGPKGHRARICQAYKHQMRDGQHAWQQASIDDIVPPVYVWHVPDPKHGPILLHELKSYYGKLPAVVELFSQAGAEVGEEYYKMMRADVAIPTEDEAKLAV